ncbi:type III pantothenate kinase [Tenacibaculum sp. IB213877]|uniref:type III pantothenate kinase n=1 Tax=Tenacibaculum sp. IB213877 TaxID=3097351 RepID=UPI002A59FBDA|nr:type III pantothenate kinase [Tenacibaculum sp. IB213877]MDY0780218.1 type III pantothenate kinase [Tenacibaculum sp. IB213877]
MNLIIDVGNTRAKVAVFEADTIQELVVFNKSRIISEIKKITTKFSISSAIISSVAKLSTVKLQRLHQLLKLVELNHETKVPFKNLYATPKTLGVDRIALASAAIHHFPDTNVLVIDAGTCITFDFITKKGEYLGGAISPGMNMRYKALNNYTAKLPLLKAMVSNSFIGNNTQNSIHSGVVNGVCNEIDGVINQYKKKFNTLTVVLTGGDTNFLAKQLKNGIFANPNFVLEGLQTILNYNTAND